MNTSKRRLFVGSKQDPRCVFTFNQRDDGSIYICSARFQEIVWYAIDDEAGMCARTFSAGAKLSVHGSGVSHIKDPGGEAEFRYEGTFLRREEQQTLGLRHLITAFLAAPEIQSSPPGSRPTDTVLSKLTPSPGIFVFFAVPALGAEIEGINFRIPADSQCSEPQHQWGQFRLHSHLIVWYFYRTKFMDCWPEQTHACALDGLHVPLMVGIDNFKVRIETKLPKISLVNNHLKIDLG